MAADVRCAGERRGGQLWRGVCSGRADGIDIAALAGSLDRLVAWRGDGGSPGSRLHRFRSHPGTAAGNTSVVPTTFNSTLDTRTSGFTFRQRRVRLFRAIRVVDGRAGRGTGGCAHRAPGEA